MADWLASVPEFGLGLEEIQFHESPPLAPGTEPAGSLSSTQTILGELVAVTITFVTANTRRPSGSKASACTQLVPALPGAKVNRSAKVGSWLSACQIIRTLLRSRPGACKESVAVVPSSTGVMGTAILPAT